MSYKKYFSEIDKTRDSLPYKSIEDARHYMQKMIDDANNMDGKIFVAEEKDQIIGFIQGVIIKHEKGADTFYDLTHNPSKEGWVGLLFVKPEYRGGGTGKQLLDEIKNYFISKNCTSIKLLVLSDNKHAIAVYEKNGFMRHDLEMTLKIWCKKNSIGSCFNDVRLAVYYKHILCIVNYVMNGQWISLIKKATMSMYLAPHDTI